MATLDPLYLRPVVGYAMHHLARGVPLNDVYGMLRSHREYGHLNAADRATAVNRALENQAATLRAQGADERSLIGAHMSRPIAGTEPIGVRVAMTVSGPVRDEIVSVTVNASPGTSIGEILVQAKAFFETGAALGRYRMGTPREVVGDPVILAVVEGGLESPGLTL